MTDIIPVKDLFDSDIARFLSYPEYDEGIIGQREVELQSLGVSHLSFGGPHRIREFPILGKGHVGIVLRGLWGGVKVAVKVRRIDADRATMAYEAGMIGLANSVDVGPVLHGFTDNVLVMELISGMYFRDWVQEETVRDDEVKRALRGLLVKVRRLDEIGLDHGELTSVRRHFIMASGVPRIIDFESASTKRQVQNVTTTVQSFFLRPGFSKLLGEKIVIPDRTRVIEVSRAYKRDPSDSSFQDLLVTCGLG